MFPFRIDHLCFLNFIPRDKTEKSAKLRHFRHVLYDTVCLAANCLLFALNYFVQQYLGLSSISDFILFIRLCGFIPAILFNFHLIYLVVMNKRIHLIWLQFGRILWIICMGSMVSYRFSLINYIYGWVQDFGSYRTKFLHQRLINFQPVN